MKEFINFWQRPDVIVCSVILILLLIGRFWGKMKYTSIKL